MTKKYRLHNTRMSGGRLQNEWEDDLDILGEWDDAEEFEQVTRRRKVLRDTDGGEQRQRESRNRRPRKRGA